MSRIFSDILQNVVTKLNTDTALIAAIGARPIQFLYGHYRSIADELIVKGLELETRDQKYPLIILGIDNEYLEQDINDQQYTINANIWIVEETKREWFTSERYDAVFKVVLYPIYEAFKRELCINKSVSSRMRDVSFQVVPIPYWGTQAIQGSDSKIVNDPLDALKIKFSGLTLNKGC